MPYFAVALACTDEGWVGAEVDLEDAEDLEAVAEDLRDRVGDGPGPVLMLLEQDEEYVGIVRLEAGSLSEPRVFLSDVRAVHGGGVAALLWEDESGGDDEDDDEGTRPVAEPVGDASLLADLGTPAEDLLRLCAEEGLLPADVHTALCERAGCLDALEAVREG